MKLTIELVPAGAWFTNLRSILTTPEWDVIRKKQYKKSGYVCDVCGGKGERWPVECHEIWEYDDENHAQKLVRFTSLCPACHMVKHIGLAEIRGKYDEALRHLMKINEMSQTDARMYIDGQFDVWRYRSQHEWKIDISLVRPEETGELIKGGE